MALDKSKLKSSLKNMFESVPKNHDAAAEMLANIIYDFVTSAEVTVTALTGEVAVEGTAAAQANVAPLTFKGNDATHVGGLS